MAGFVKPENVRYRGGTCVSREEQPQKVAESWMGSAFVALDANGELEEISTTPASVTGIYAIDHFPADALSAAPAARNVEPVQLDAEIRISISHSGDELLAVTSQALVGKLFELRKVVSGGEDYWTVDINGTTDPAVQIQKISPEFPIGEQHGVVYAKVRKDLLQYQP